MMVMMNYFCGMADRQKLLSQPAITFSKLTVETQAQYVQC